MAKVEFWFVDPGLSFHRMSQALVVIVRARLQMMDNSQIKVWSEDL